MAVFARGMNVTFYKSDDFFERTHRGLRRSQIAEETEVVNCRHCDHVHLLFRNCAGEIFAIAAISDEIIDMIVAARREIEETQHA